MDQNLVRLKEAVSMCTDSVHLQSENTFWDSSDLDKSQEVETWLTNWRRKTSVSQDRLHLTTMFISFELVSSTVSEAGSNDIMISELMKTNWFIRFLHSNREILPSDTHQSTNQSTNHFKTKFRWKQPKIMMTGCSYVMWLVSPLFKLQSKNNTKKY